MTRRDQFFLNHFEKIWYVFAIAGVGISCVLIIGIVSKINRSEVSDFSEETQQVTHIYEVESTPAPDGESPLILEDKKPEPVAIKEEVKRFKVVSAPEAKPAPNVKSKPKSKPVRNTKIAKSIKKTPDNSKNSEHYKSLVTIFKSMAKHKSRSTPKKINEFLDSHKSDLLLVGQIRFEINKNKKFIQDNNLLHAAAYANFHKIVPHLVEAGVSLEHKNEYGMTPLKMARHEKVAEALVKAGANLKSVDIFGNSVLHHTQRSKLGQYFISQGVDVNSINVQGRTPIFYSSSGAMVDFFQSHGADLNRKDYEGFTPYDFSKLRRHFLVEKALIKHKAMKGANHKKISVGVIIKEKKFEENSLKRNAFIFNKVMKNSPAGGKIQQGEELIGIAHLSDQPILNVQKFDKEDILFLFKGIEDSELTLRIKGLNGKVRDVQLKRKNLSHYKTPELTKL